MNRPRSISALGGRWVVKIGSALLSDDHQGLRRETLGIWAQQMVRLRTDGVELVVVSSGAVAAGAQRLAWKQRPHSLSALQAAAAVGQMDLVQAWASCFREHGVDTAQVLLTHDDVADRRRYLNARTALRTIMDLGVVAVVNENDTVATEEICLGDNDALAALVANLIEADVLIILTDQAGLYQADPRQVPGATLVPEGRAGDPALEQYAGDGSGLGRGGMRTKLQAARIAARSGTDTVIASGHERDILSRLAQGESPGTRLRANCGPMAARKRWLAVQSRTRGGLTLDAGALRAVVEKGKSVLAAGVVAVRGDFQKGEIIACTDSAGRERARGLVNYMASEVQQIMGRRSADIAAILGYHATAELIHRDNLIVL